MTDRVVLFESAIGYALFDVKEVEEIGIELSSVQEAAQHLDKFGKIVKLKAIMPFRSAQDALENINEMSEGLLPDLLRNFLETHLPKSSSIKKSKVTLGVADNKIGQAIAEELHIKCDHTGVVPELIRGIRMHFSKMHKSIKDVALDKAQLGLGHSYSRAKVKFNVHRVDNMIIQAISLLDQLDKDINTFSMRVKEWYGYHFPELAKLVVDNTTYARLVDFIGRRNAMSDDMLEKIEEMTMDSAKAQQIIDAAKTSMGMDISDIDLISVKAFAKRVVSLATYRQQLMEYLRTKMASCAPNLSALIGEQVGARLISHAGSLTNLAKYPASTVQILGAEKALFRALKTRGNTPKYGLIFHSTFIGRAGAKNKGRISRYLANKCSIASRIDCFSDALTGKFGEELREQVEERLRFYETGETPRKNIDVMHKVMESMDGEDGTSVPPPAGMDKKGKTKRTHEEADAPATPAGEEKAKKKKKSKSLGGDESAGETPSKRSKPATPGTEEKAKKKKKKSKKSKE
jgi:RNA processing factor Prp31